MRGLSVGMFWETLSALYMMLATAILWIPDDSVWPYNGQFMDHPYGENDGASYCRDRRYWGCNRWGTERGPAVKLTWQEVWLKKRWGWWMKMPKSPTTSVKNDPPGVWINRSGQYMADSGSMNSSGASQ